MRRILVACALVIAAAQVSATQVYCKEVSTTKNYMAMSDAYAASCMDAGPGNISGNSTGANPDPFMTGVGSGFNLISKTDSSNPFVITYTTSVKSKTETTGTWSIDSDFWNHYEDAALGFKFGTGNKPDEWFVFELVGGVSSGTWDFFNVFEKGGGLSHVNLYASKIKTVLPEPNSALLMLIGALMLVAARRQSRRA
ncbi:PEP-CTERM sorting domain-containing protein [Simiduia aestuariiviva]|uniref:PEP-CTERM sorting domain-containing protein n=1 Tax=Simiduia aestuariiviva TaxID=1510459 RepID=UPI001C8603E9|nr:PEP-CTERM sorting domain-containing protein [Simiduia aestuariiviva]